MAKAGLQVAIVLEVANQQAGIGCGPGDFIGAVSAYHGGVTWSLIEWSLIVDPVPRRKGWGLVTPLITMLVTCHAPPLVTISFRRLFFNVPCYIAKPNLAIARWLVVVGMPAMLEPIPLQAGCPPRGGL